MGILTKQELDFFESEFKKEQKIRIGNIYKSMLSKIKDGDPIPTLEMVSYLVEKLEDNMTTELMRQEDNLLLYGTIEKP